MKNLANALKNKGRAVKCTLVIKRPNGEIERVVHPTLKDLSQNQFEQIQKGTKEAGRGDVLSFEVERKITDDSAMVELAKKAKAYDDLHNEGGEGFNPYR